MPRPIPAEPPVTAATRPSHFMVLYLLKNGLTRLVDERERLQVNERAKANRQDCLC